MDQICKVKEELKLFKNEGKISIWGKKNQPSNYELMTTEDRGLNGDNFNKSSEKTTLKILLLQA